ncbi:MAG: hypothetical protein ACRCZF_20025 [Gemmataceae bacterium]
MMSDPTLSAAILALVAVLTGFAAHAVAYRWLGLGVVLSYFLGVGIRSGGGLVFALIASSDLSSETVYFERFWCSWLVVYLLGLSGEILWATRYSAAGPALQAAPAQESGV